MTEQEQRIAIAEACGWSYRIHPQLGTFWWNDEINKTLSEGDDGFRQCPDYLHDLNAMHEAERYLLSKGNIVYNCFIDNLHIVIHGEECQVDGSYDELRKVIHASAKQKAEAFLKTIGKWKD